jgi:hypothetical protein
MGLYVGMGSCSRNKCLETGCRIQDAGARMRDVAFGLGENILLEKGSLFQHIIDFFRMYGYLQKSIPCFIY